MRLELGRLARNLGGLRVEETASCARALTAMVGRMPSVELLPGGAAQVTRAMLTARVLGARDRSPWPNAMMHQLDPDDPAFLPTLGMHPVLAARDRTLLGLPEGDRVAWVDPGGWIGVGDGPSVTAWWAVDHHVRVVGRCPGQQRTVDCTRQVQARSDTGVGVRTTVENNGLEIVLVHWPLILEGRVAWALHLRATSTAEAPVAGRLALALRPMTAEGVAPIFRLERDREGLWKADGVPLLAMARPGTECFASDGRGADPWQAFLGACRRERAPLPNATPLDVRCPAGQASGVEVWPFSLRPGESTSAFAIIAPPAGTTSALLRTSAPTLWASANADRRGLLSSGCAVRLGEHQALLEACRDRLLTGPERRGLAASLAALALARLGFTRRAGDRLARQLSEVRRGGRMLGAGPEEPAALAWAAAEYVRWTGDTAWVREHSKSWCRLLDRLLEDAPQPGGQSLFGPDGSLRWTRLWRAAALLSSASVLRKESHHRAWALAGGAEREGLPELLGQAPWSASPDRAADGSAAAMLAAVWLGLVPASDSGVADTVAFLRERCWHGGGVLLGGGAHCAATTLFAAAVSRIDERFDALGTIAALASSTGALPTARHPARGALGEGDDPLAAALFVLLALDRVWVQRDRITVLPGLAAATDLPTPYGRLDIRTGANGRVHVVGRWRSRAPRVEVRGQGDT